MSQSNTPNSTPYVKPGSVPQCLRHTMPCVPLEEAAWIAEFLGAACEALLTSDESVNAEAAAGFRLCNSLLLDKIAIASGELPFPLVDMFNKTDDVLLSPEQKEAAQRQPFPVFRRVRHAVAEPFHCLPDHYGRRIRHCPHAAARHPRAGPVAAGASPQQAEGGAAGG